MRVALLLALSACSGSSALDEPDAAPGSGSATPDAAVIAKTPLEVRALGVQGFMLHYGHDAVMTAPLFTRQSAIEVTFNVPVQADTAAIDAGLAGVSLDELRAVV